MKLTKQYTARDQQSLASYFQEISNYDPIPKDEEPEVFKRYNASTSPTEKRKIRDKVINHNLRFVVAIAKQYQNQGLPLPDLISEGNIGIMKAMDRFDVTRGIKFISYAVWWIRQTILQAISDQVRILKLPLNKSGELNKYNKITNSLTLSLEREPTDEEIAKACKEVGLSNIDSIRSLTYQNPLSLDSTSQFEEENALINIIPDTLIPTPDASLMRDSLTIELLDLLKTLTPREKDVLTSFYGIEEQKLTLEEVGQKYNLTRERIRQIKEKALRRLRINKKNVRLKQFLGQ